jgi:integrase
LEVLAAVKLNGADPAAEKREKREAATVADLCRQYMEAAETGGLLVRGGKAKKPLTLASDRGRIEGHIIPLLGSAPVAEVTKRDIERFMHAVAAGKTAKVTKGKARAVSNLRGGQGVATRSIGLLGAIFAYAVDRGMRTDNPAHGIRKYAENKRERRLSDDEYAALGSGLRQTPVWPAAAACLRFLALTGWRSGEAVALRWQDVDLDRRTATLPDTKTGKSMRPLSGAACDLLRAQKRTSDNPLIFPATRGKGFMVGFKKFVRRIVADAGLPADITPHVLRHSFASLASDIGYSEATIGSLIGHKGHTITSRYVHSADSVLLAAADAIANRTAELMAFGKPSAGAGPAVGAAVPELIQCA